MSVSIVFFIVLAMTVLLQTLLVIRSIHSGSFDTSHYAAAVESFLAYPSPQHSTYGSDAIHMLHQLESILGCHGEDCLRRITDLQQQQGTPRTVTSSSIPKSRPKANTTKTAAICVIVKEEEPYIDEWTEFNLAIGFDTIYVYDNSDSFVLEHWGQQDKFDKRVQVVHHPGPQMQMDAYRHCMKDHVRRNNHEWVAFLDADEFLMLYKHEHVVDMLLQHCQQGSLGIHWMTFGTANQTHYEPLPVTKRFLYRDREINGHIKSIARVEDMRHGLTIVSPHFPMLRPYAKQFDTNGEVYQGSYQENGPGDVALLYHYKYKSLAEFYQKGCVRGRADVANKTSCVEEIIAGEVYDESGWEAMKKYVPKYRVFDDW